MIAWDRLWLTSFAPAGSVVTTNAWVGTERLVDTPPVWIMDTSRMFAAIARTFQAVSREQLEHERALAGASLTVHALEADEPATSATDRDASALAVLLADLSARGFNRLAVYGAVQAFTIAT